MARNPEAAAERALDRDVEEWAEVARQRLAEHRGEVKPNGSGRVDPEQPPVM